MYPTEKSPFYGIFVKEQVESLRKEGIVIDVVFINGRENRFNYFTSVIRLIKKLKRVKYDIIHAHHTYCIYPIIISKFITRKRTPVILTFHEGEVHKTNNLKMNNVDFIKRLVFSKKIKIFALNIVDFVISVQEELIKELNFSGKYVILPCGVDLDLFRPLEKLWCREKLGLPLNKKIIFFPASPCNENKGFHILREGLKNVNWVNIEVVAAGNINHLDMPIYMCAADVIVQLSEWEASPMVLKEAMAVNIPLVFTEVGDAKLIVENSKGCFLCKRTLQDVALKLDEALKFNKNSEGRKQIIKIGLGLHEVARKVIENYKSIISVK